MKNIFKIISILLLIPLVFSSCRDEQYDDNWKSADPSFTLYNTTLTSNVLYPTMDKNPFRLTWDNSLGGTTYNVVFSTTSDFATKIAFGTSNTNSYSTTIGALNTALLQAGYSPYGLKKVYFRVESGTKVSNAVSFDVTPYPATVPVITNPTAGKSYVLNKNLPEDNALTMLWSDYNAYGVDVTYTIELAKTTATEFVTLGTVKNLRTLDITNKIFNDAVLKLGLVPDVEASVDMRVTATTKSVGGTINKVSQVVTVKVTPYVAFKNLFLVGDATAAGWSTNNNNQAIFRDASNLNKFYFTGKFGTSMFKLLEILGDNTWQPQWGVKGGAVANSDGGDPDPFTVSSAGYYSFEVDILAKTYSITPYSGAMTTYTSIDIAGSLNGWSGSTVLTQSSFDPHQWYIKDLVVSSNGEAKFRANGNWDVNWGAGSEFSGQGTQGGANIPLNAGTYDVYFNDIDGRYVFVKK
ncbi:SusE domain-containing protein [Cloacibacterium sp. TD35]|uniref:SusE domain-containing protein n=1 Tax=Cloacibacterium sp. TD35 TaxID=2976818 RepID=UPI00237DFFE4|nr:SusE domain-containing protein [Cloacibacterium sp. TD35]WDT67319.1 SusE domain-containing protein [Cloacibacterium sp. TD35]